MAMRNFWVETQVDGRQTKAATGPQSRDGGFITRVYVREVGESVQKVRIEGWKTRDGKLRLCVDVAGGEDIYLEVKP